MGSLATSCWEVGRRDEAIKLREDALTLTEKARGEFDMLTEDQLRTLDWAEGMRMFFRGEEEPLEESTVKRGWNDAQRVVLESKDDK